MANEILELGVLKGKLLEIGFQSLLKYFSTEVMESLVEPRGTFSVGNAIKDILSSFSVDYVNLNRVGCVLLVFAQTPEALIEENTPGRCIFFKTLGLVKAQIRYVVCKRLVEPEVVPPFHGH